MQTSSEDSSRRLASTDVKTQSAEIEKLEREIRELRCIIKLYESKLSPPLLFKDVEDKIELRDSRILRAGRIPNVQLQLQNDLYRFAGFRCVRFRRDEIVFNFTPTKKRQADDTYAIQIFVKNGKGNLGKWVMPMSVNMSGILAKTPLEQLRNLVPFTKSCKHNIDCYVTRREQFQSLKEYTSHIKHCTLETNMGYTQIILELYCVCDNENDNYINLVIYLFYHSNVARPHKIQVDTTDKKELNEETKRRLKACLKEFKLLDLQAAFDKVLTKSNSTFTWICENDSPLELNDTSSSDEGFLAKFHEKSLRKAKRKRELQKKWNQRKRQRTTKDILPLDDNDSHLSNSEEILLAEKTKQTVSKKRKSTEKIASTSKQQQIDRNVMKETPIYKPKDRLRQTKLNFQRNDATNIDSVNRSLLGELKLYGKKGKTTKPLFTSTPLHPTRKRSSLNNTGIDNITVIEHSPQQTTSKLNDSKSVIQKIKIL